MNTIASPDPFGTVTEPATLTMQRLLPGPIERVWSYLTESELRREWLAGGEMSLEQGAPFELVWRNDELSRAPAERPDGFPEEQRMGSTITAIDAPRRLSFTWTGGGEITFDLAPQGDDVILTLTHRRLPNRDTTLKVAAGWHMHLDILVDRANGRETPPFWPGWQRLREEYDQRLPG